MSRLNDIEVRLSEIKASIDTAENLTELDNEMNALMEERKTIMANAEQRKAMIETITNIEAEGEKIPMNEVMEVRTYSVDSAEYRTAFLENLMGREISAEARTAITAAAAIPTETMNQIVGKLELAPIINAVDVTYIPGNVTYPVEGTINAANWVAMGTAATDSADTLAPVSLAAYKLIKTVEVTADVMAMSVPAFEAWLVERLANKISRAVAAGIMVGTGSSQATGLSTLSATGTYTKTAITYSDIMNIIASLNAEYMPNASFVMSRATFFGNVLNIQDTNKKPIVVADVQSPAKFNILGFPVIIEDEAGTDVYFGDLKEGYKFNFAKAPVVARDESVAFRSGSTVFRALALADGKPTGVGVVRYTKATA